MQNLKFSVSVVLEEMTCKSCAGTYALSERFLQERHRQGGSWNCPYCKDSYSFTESEVDGLKKELALAKKRTEWAMQDAKYEKDCSRAQRAAKTKLKNRIANGVCPCCNRSFLNMANHIKSKHPEYIKNEK